MPPTGLGQEAPPDFGAHPDYQPLFETLVAGGQTREQASLLLTNLWRNRIHNNEPQQHVQPQPADSQHRAYQGSQLGQADPDGPEQVNPGHEPQQPLPPPLPNRDEHPEQPQDLEQGQDLQPPALGAPHPPQDALPLPSDDFDGSTHHKADKRGTQLPPIDLDAHSRTLSLQRPTEYAIEKFTKFEYVPLWYFTQQGCQAADRDKASNGDLWDITKTSDNRLARRTAAANRPSPSALSDEQLSWEQFMDGNHLLCRWLIPAGWPEGYAKVLSSFFWQIENHEDIGVPEGKETLLLYQARARKAWHDELKVGYFFNLAKLDEKRMNAYHKEVDAKHNAVIRKAAMAVFGVPAQDAAPIPSGKAKPLRARDTGGADGAPPLLSHPHPYRRAAPSPSHSFRASPSDQPQALCLVCLRRPHPNMRECREETLSDGEPAYTTRKLGHLVDHQGKSLCADFQLPKGCPSKRHSTRHRCSGCGSNQHGAVECTRRASN